MMQFPLASLGYLAEWEVLGVLIEVLGVLVELLGVLIELLMVLLGKSKCLCLSGD
jgi:hypothetical protein